MNLFDAVILGIVEGITEFLPISSTGHMMMTGRILGLEQTAFLKTFEIAIQLGGILAVVFLYGKPLLLNLKVCRRIAAAFIPTAIVGMALYKLIKHVFMDNVQIVLGALAFGGACLIIFELLFKEKKSDIGRIEDISYRQAVIIGLFQSLAVVPGISRAGATIVGGMAQGISRKTIVDFSFILAIPTMGAAVGLDMFRSAAAFSGDQFMLLAIGFTVSFLVALAAVKVFIRYVQRSTFLIFGLYRIIVALTFWLYFK